MGLSIKWPDNLQLVRIIVTYLWSEERYHSGTVALLVDLETILKCH